MRPTIEVLASPFLDDKFRRPYSVYIPVDKILNIDHACWPDNAVLDLEDSEHKVLWVQETVSEVYSKINVAMQITK